MSRDVLNRTLAWLDLQNDPVFNKIPSDRYHYYLDNALMAGERVADAFSGSNIRELYDEHCIEIELKQADGLFFTVQFRAQFEFSEKKALRKVTLYQPSLESLQTSCAAQGLMLETDAIIDIHLAHEFFHYLEYAQQKPVSTSLDKVCHIAFGPFRRYSTVTATSEIAAHRFCQRLHRLEYYPTWFDFLWLVHSGKLTQQEADERLSQARDELFRYGLL